MQDIVIKIDACLILKIIKDNWSIKRWLKQREVMKSKEVSTRFLKAQVYKTIIQVLSGMKNNKKVKLLWS